MAATYDKQGIRFLYPDNWKIDTDQDSDWPESVSVQSPDGAFWSITIHPPDADFKELNETILEAMQQECEQFESEPIAEIIDGTPAVGHNMNFYCLDLLIAAQLRTFQQSGRTFMLLCQAEDRDFEKLEPVFGAITKSLLDPTVVGEQDAENV